jgi:hypothetical protein
MKTCSLSAPFVSATGELTWCALCTGVCLLGSAWLVVLDVPTSVLVAYAAASGAFAFIGNVTAGCRYWRRNRTR